MDWESELNNEDPLAQPHNLPTSLLRELVGERVAGRNIASRPLLTRMDLMRLYFLLVKPLKQRTCYIDAKAKDTPEVMDASTEDIASNLDSTHASRKRPSASGSSVRQEDASGYIEVVIKR